MNMSPENKAHFQAEKEAIHMILTGIRVEIYSTVDACQTALEMWEAIERLQQGDSLNIQDVKTNLFWEFGKFTSHDGETMESYYTRFYKLMNEMLRNNLTVATMQVNVQFLQQLQPEWSRNPKRVKDSAYHKEKMLLCKQAEQYDWLVDTDEEINEQELEAHYSYMAKIQEVHTADTGINSEPLEQVQNDAGYNVFSNNLQHSKQSESISNTCLVETDDSNVIPDSPDIKTLRESNSVRDSCLVTLQNKQTEFEKYKAFNDRTVEYKKLKRKLNETLGQLALKDIEIKEGLKTKAYEISVVKEKHDELIKQSFNKVILRRSCQAENKEIVDNAWIKHSKDQFRAPTALDIEILIQTCLMPLAIKTQNESFIFVHELKQEMHADL
nr:hypothetical protein [Tanacetum cinerariifolium]